MKPWWRSPRAIPVAIYCALHAGFSLFLDLAGHAPSFGGLIARHYLLQAILLVPMTVLGWVAFSAVVRPIALPKKPLRDVMLTVAPPLYLPITILFVLVDIAAYIALGFEGLAVIIRVAAPMTFVVATLACVITLRREEPKGGLLRAVLGVLLAFLVLGIVTGSWLR